MRTVDARRARTVRSRFIMLAECARLRSALGVLDRAVADEPRRPRKVTLRYAGQTSGARRLILAIAVLVLYALHQDVWFWREARPLLFGFLPVGLTYHAAYCVAAALLMAALVRFAWPERLEAEAEGDPPR
jgi:uncharacterized protein DUF3311